MFEFTSRWGRYKCSCISNTNTWKSLKYLVIQRWPRAEQQQKCSEELQLCAEGGQNPTNTASPLHQRHQGHSYPPLQDSDWALTWGGRAACSPPSLLQGPLARHRQSSDNRWRFSGPGAAGGGCCQTASGPNPGWRLNRRKQEVWSPWAASDWKDWRRQGGGGLETQRQADGATCWTLQYTVVLIFLSILFSHL